MDFLKFNNYKDIQISIKLSVNFIINLKDMSRSTAMKLRLSVELVILVMKNKVLLHYRNKKIGFLSELNMTYCLKRNRWIMYISRFEF